MKKTMKLAMIFVLTLSLGACAITSKVASPKPDVLEAKFVELQKEKDELAASKQTDYEFCSLGYRNGLFGVVFNSLIEPSSDIEISWYDSNLKCQPDSEIEITIISLQEYEIYSYLIVIDPCQIKYKQFQLLIRCELPGKKIDQLFFVHNGEQKDIEKSEEQ